MSSQSESSQSQKNQAQLAQKTRSALKAEDYSTATAMAKKQVEDYPEDCESYYLLAVSLRYSGDVGGAQAAITRLLSLDIKHARAYQEQGHNFAKQGCLPEQVESYRRAVELNPALHASWKGLALGLRTQGIEAEALQALHQFQQLQTVPPVLLSAASLMYEKKLLKAEQLCRSYLQKNKHHPEAMRLLALIGAELGVLDDADFLLESCLEMNPDFHQARFDYIGILRKRQKFAAALQQASLLRTGQGGQQSDILFATQSAMVGDYQAALQIYDQIIVESPELHGVQLQRGHVLKTVGESARAIEAYQAAYRAKPDFGDAYWSLANMKIYRFGDDEIAKMRELQGLAATARVDRYHLCFALGKALEDRADYAASFSWYEQGNALKQEECQYSIEDNRRDIDLEITHCTPELFDKNPVSGFDVPDPIFIVGLPRAGSTLLEQILASHPQVDGTFELHNIIASARRLDGRRRTAEGARYPAVLHDLTADQLEQIGRRYIEETAIHRGKSSLFIDKMPNNFRHIGLIQLILPSAKIIDARRHPMACCFSGFKQLFAEGQEFTYGLGQMGEYYRDYVRLMGHWDKVLPGKVLRVQYEAVVEDLEGQVRRLLDYCDLPFAEECLQFHRTERAVRTPSAEQVRQPIYRSGTDQWKHFESKLEPLRMILSEALKPYSVS
ncbi:sulfotransferase [Microbulbifer sp. OS29]|uniref:Sulfotransferase n=1 Tax=Microbulbifer okhotskensis TaxID=2926617 RepID=A0A9X2EPZ6_9GAMM|nr:tetratricopeptide repeat-containing sulfotransferase family protein [Microbulbifer okhotskensis]MCO1335711.1 sulfotransferase [Microbulbifer okhotskensis]